jgi:hypothetical protein
VKSRLLLNVVVGQGATVLKLFSGKNEALLVRRNPLFILNLLLNVIYAVRGFYL